MSPAGKASLHNFAAPTKLLVWDVGALGRVPMQILKRYDPAEILMLAASVLIITAVAFVF
jgi:hypothetical protein